MLDASAYDRLAAPFAAAARVVVADYAPRPDTLAILLAGSVTRGQGDPHSDLDIWIVSGGRTRQRRSVVLHGAPVEIFHNPLGRTERYFAEGDASAMNMVGYGWPVYVRDDAQETIAALQARARAAYEAGPPPLSPAAEAPLRYMVVDALWDAEDSLAAAAALTLHAALDHLLRYYYAKQALWQPKWKRVPADLAARDPPLAASVERFAAAGDTDTRYAALRAALDRVMPAGYGAEQWQWETIPEDVTSGPGS
jgi:hypothetical protein